MQRFRLRNVEKQRNSVASECWVDILWSCAFL